MADINALYPQPVQPGGGNALLSDPTKVMGLLNQAAALRGQNISNETALMQQQQAARGAIQSFIGSQLAGIPNPSDDDVRNAAVFAARSFPEIAIRYPDMITDTRNFVSQHPKGVKYGSGLLLNSQLPPETATSEVTGPPNPITGAQTVVKRAAANLVGGRETTLPMGSDDSTRLMLADQARESSYATDIVPLTRSLELAQKLGPGGMAPGSKGRQEFESFVYGLMPSLVPPAMQDKIKNYAELEKYLTNNASLRAQSLGPHTNEGLATAVTGSPNVHINDLAGVDLIKAQLALRKMEHAQVVQAAAGGGPNYANVKSTLATQHDPRAYAIDTMSPDQIQSLQKTLKGAERARFNRSLQAAINSGVIERK